jgi:CHASE1-domain containing sensor protein
MPDLSEFTRKWQPVRLFWPIVAAACVGLAVAVSAWFAVSIWEERLARAKFTAVAGDYASVLQNGIDEYLGKILAVRAFYDASVEVDPDEFNLFTSRIL